MLFRRSPNTFFQLFWKRNILQNHKAQNFTFTIRKNLTENVFKSIQFDFSKFRFLFLRGITKHKKMLWGTPEMLKIESVI